MSFWKTLFGPTKEEIWQQLSREISAEYVDGDWWWADKVQAHVKDWIITLDTYTVSTGKSSTTYTRLRAPYLNRDGLRFMVYRRGFFTDLGKWLGMVQDIEVGQSDFDRDFVIQGNDASKLKALFANPRVRELIHLQPSIYFHVQDDDGWFGTKFPDGVDELRFQVYGVIKEVPRLKNLFDLFVETLNQLHQMDSASKDDVSLLIESLLSPGGQIKSEVVLWDGTPPRRRAAEALGQLKVPQAVAPLIKVLDDEDLGLRIAAMKALGEIGDARAVPVLIPKLGVVGERTAAAAVLHKLGAGELAQAFLQTLSGDQTTLPKLKGSRRSEVIQGLIQSLGDPDAPTIVNAAWALGELGALEALPHLRSKVGLFSFPTAELKEACNAAIHKLEMLAALPRAAEATTAETTLPRPAREPETHPETLPRAAEGDERP
jgi:HEAT repeat protein